MDKAVHTETGDPIRQQDIDAVAWFASLIHARQVEDFRRAADVLSALEQIGIYVRFRRPRGGRCVAGVARPEGQKTEVAPSPTDRT